MLIDVRRACDRIRAAREAIPHGHPFVLNVRTDPYLCGGDPEACFAEAVRRAHAYADAGADCVFVPGPMDAATVGRLAVAIPSPLNVLSARAGREASLTVADLERLGVRRVVAGVVPGIERQPVKKLEPDEAGLLRLLQRWRDEAEKGGGKFWPRNASSDPQPTQALPFCTKSLQVSLASAVSRQSLSAAAASAPHGQRCAARFRPPSGYRGSGRRPLQR